MRTVISDIMTTALEELALEVDGDCLEKFELLAMELSKWNSKLNLTSIRLPSEIVIKHFIDSLSVIREVGSSGRLLDIGSGAGFPGLPLKIISPDLNVVSVDSVEKKIFFQRSVARLLKLENFTALHSRIELLPESMTCGFDRIVSRAFSDLPTFIRVALPLLAPEGEIVAMKGAGGRKEALEAAEAIQLLGATIINIREFRLPMSSDLRTVLVLKRSERKSPERV